ncbi:EF-hand domain-containing protein [Neorhizobium sp. T25_13]|uniref:EF-hand domain-containing protein n=1 Tax=Neorhizobium sp. T25_13 TaxID=2093830 RepID=UPI000CF8ED2D|nr:EF-hand domain-containing protein [Neorhizobium sp. T25_13]
MNVQNVIRVSVTAFAVFAATGAFAQWNGGWNGWHLGPGVMDGSGGRFPGFGRGKIIDQNDDGRISDDEAAATADDVFIAMDADDDGQITKEEYLAVRMGAQWGWNQQRQSAMQARREARFAEIDPDKNDAVSKVEFMDAAQARHKAADADKDGYVSPWEHRRDRGF